MQKLWNVFDVVEKTGTLISDKNFIKKKYMVK